MNIKQYHFFSTICTSFALALFPHITIADAGINCEVYAHAAVLQAQESGALGCGFAGAGWADDYALHFNWCKSPGVGIADLGREDQARETALAQCKQAPSTLSQSAVCTYYANAMVAFSNRNTVLNCGLTGSRFSIEFPAHFAWCSDVPNKTQFVAELKIAETAILACKNDPTKVDPDILTTGTNTLLTNPSCDHYANTMVGMALENIAIPCGFTDNLYDNNYPGHYHWCNNSPSKVPVLAAMVRANSEISTCKSTQQ